MTCNELIPTGRCRRCERDRDRQRGPEKRARRAGSSGVVAEVKRRDGRCVMCGATAHLEAHHITPIAAGGGHSEANLVTLCRECHRRAHAAA